MPDIITYFIILDQLVDMKDIDQYIAGFPKDVQNVMEQVRSTIRNAAPEAEEAIKYGIPTFVLNGNLVHFAAYKSHIGFYPGAITNKPFEKDLAGYKKGKGSVQFPLDEPVPLDLIARIVHFRRDENLQKIKAKRR